MNEINRIRDNLAKIRELDDRLGELKKMEHVERHEKEVVYEENIELQILLEELEQQQQISITLAQQNQKLQKSLNKRKVQLSLIKTDFEVFEKKQVDALIQKKKEHEERQAKEDSEATKEEKRLKTSLQLLIDKNKKLKMDKEALEAKARTLRLQMLGKQSKKTTPLQTQTSQLNIDDVNE